MRCSTKILIFEAASKNQGSLYKFQIFQTSKMALSGKRVIHAGGMQE
jgi:hypothetical protein